MMHEEPALWIKFSGETLDVRSVPMYELGATLLAVQRIIYKTFLYSNNRLYKRAKLTRDERKGLALQISKHKKSSDAYGLLPFLTDPIVQQSIGLLLEIGLQALSRYALKSVFPNENSSLKNIASLNAYDAKGAVEVVEF